MRQQGWLAKGGRGALCCSFPSQLARGDAVVTSCPALLCAGAQLSPWPHHQPLPSTMTQFPAFQQFALKIDQSCHEEKPREVAWPALVPTLSVQAGDQNDSCCFPCSPWVTVSLLHTHSCPAPSPHTLWWDPWLFFPGFALTQPGSSSILDASSVGSFHWEP